MELLGAYSSQLTPAYYQQLLALLDAAISSGDLSGGSAFNQNALLALEQQAQSFDQLPTGTSGSRVTDDSFNYPFSLPATYFSSRGWWGGPHVRAVGNCAELRPFPPAGRFATIQIRSRQIGLKQV